MMGEILDTDFALLPGDAEAVIEIDYDAQYGFHSETQDNSGD